MKNIWGLFTLLFALSSLATPLKEVKTFTTKKYDQHFAKGLSRNKIEHLKFLKRVGVKLFAADSVVPSKYDLSLKVSPPENQGSCGSCWAFSITKALRSEFMLAAIDPGRLAFNYLISNCGGVVNWYGCGGGDFSAAENMLNGKGPWLENQDPYQGRAAGCKQGLSVAGTALNWNLVGSSSRAPTFQELAQANYNDDKGHVLSVDVAVCGQWENYSSGIFSANQCGAGGINHMIDLVGYDCETSVDASGNCAFVNGQPKNGDGYLKVMNNWGNSWGEQGYMRTRWGVDAIANTAMLFEINRPTPPTPPAPPVPPAPTPTPVNYGLLSEIALGLIALAALIWGALKLFAKK